MSTPRSMDANPTKARLNAHQLMGRLGDCWKHCFDWDLLPKQLTEGCHQVGRAISVPAIAVLAGLLLTVGFSMSHSTVQVEGTDWIEPVLVWIAVCMPTGSGKSGLCKVLKNLVSKAQQEASIDKGDVSWCLDDQSFEKMGALMAENHGRSLGIYDELAMFLSQINVFRSRGLADSHELAVFLQLYGGCSWTRRTVSGDANFSITQTGLTVGGFIQPSVARTLIEQQANVEKGLCQRFLWLVPEPTLATFDMLQQVPPVFMDKIACLMGSLWTPERGIRKWILPRRQAETSCGSDEGPIEMSCGVFQVSYDKVQGDLRSIGCMDELLSGMLSKSKGQILRVATILHILFHVDDPSNIPVELSEESVKAAENFVNICLQHAAFIGGRGKIQDAIDDIKAQHHSRPVSLQDHSDLAAYCLLLPGTKLNLSALLAAKRFRDKGNKDAAVKAFKVLEKGGLGKLIEAKSIRGTSFTYEFEKNYIPADDHEKEELAAKLLTFGVSLKQYMVSLAQDEIINAGKKRKDTSATPEPPRKSPRRSTPIKIRESGTPQRERTDHDKSGARRAF